MSLSSGSRYDTLRDFVILHIAFAIPTALILIVPMQIATSAKLLVVVIYYNALTPVWAVKREHGEWLKGWKFVLPLSILQVFPDWFLVEQLNVLNFPDDGFLTIGSIPIYMAGLWVIPLFIIIILSLEMESRHGSRPAIVLSAIVALMLFGAAEETLWMLGSWSAVNVVGMLDHIALYIIIPEVLLGVSTFVAYKSLKEKEIAVRIVGAYFIMILYLGNAAFFYFIVERLLLGA